MVHPLKAGLRPLSPPDGSMEVSEILEKLSYHSQMAAGWDYVQEHLKSFLSDSVTQVIPVSEGVDCTQVSLACLQELIVMAEGNGDEHKGHIEELRSMRTSAPKGKVTKLKGADE